MKISDIKNKRLQKYLISNHKGCNIYVPKSIENEERHTKKMAVQILRKNKFNDKEICKALAIFPSWLKKME